MAATPFGRLVLPDKASPIQFMTEVLILQLLALVLMLMLAGKGGGLEQFKPIIEEIGGEEAADAFKQAEELSEVINAVQSLSSQAASSGNSAGATADKEVNGADCADGVKGSEEAGEGFPLAPISAIADERITYCLSRYITLGE